MREYLNFLNGASMLWAGLLWRASVTGGVVILLLWALCRLWPRMSPAGRSWLWRAVFCKLLLSLLWPASVNVPLLPAAASPALSTSRAISDSPSASFRLNQIEASHDAAVPSSGPAAAPSQKIAMGDEVEHSIGTSSHPEANPTSLRRPEAFASLAKSAIPRLASFALVCWLIGIGFLMRHGLVTLRITRSWRNNSKPLDDPALSQMVDELCPPLALARAPQLLCCPDIDALALTGVRYPAMLLPPELAQSWATGTTNTANAQLMLAHELAHQKRRDLAWNWLLWAGQTLFWFHPLVWLAAREWRMAQEVACDALAVQTTRTSVANYGAMLMQTALTGRDSHSENLFAVSVSERYATLHRRLSAMKHFTLKAESRCAPAFVAVLAALMVVPWHVTARSAPEDEALPRATGSASRNSELSEAALAASRRANNGRAVMGVFVQDGAGRPIRGAMVVINVDTSGTSDDTLMTAQTDKNGLATFRVAPPPSGTRFRDWAMIYAPSYAIAGCALAEGTNAVARLEKGASVHGLVTDTQGHPLPGVEIQLRAAWRGNDETQSGVASRLLFVILTPFAHAFTVRSDAHGIWTMPGLPQQGQANFGITDSRFYDEQFLVQLHAGGTTAAPRRVLLGATVAGRVRFPDGRPAAGMQVTAGGGMLSEAALTGSDGSYRVTGLGTTTARVLVEDPAKAWIAPVVSGLKTRRGIVIHAPDITLTRGSLLKGRVVDDVSGAPIPSALLTAHFGGDYWAHLGDTFAITFADAQGRYTLRVLPGSGWVGATDYTSNGPGHQPNPGLPYTIGDGETRTFTMRMTPTLALDGTAHDEAGRVVRDAVIVVRPAGNPYRLKFEDFRSQTTNADGTWRITHLPRGTMQLESRGAWQVVSPQQVTLPATGPISVTLRRVVLPSVSGRVLTPDGRPLSNAEVEVVMNVHTRLGYIQTEHLGTDAQGRFELHDLRREATVTIRARKPGYVFVSGGQVSRRNGSFEVADVILKPKPPTAQ